MLLIPSVFCWVAKFFELLLGIELTFNFIMRGCSEVELDGLWDPDLCLVRRSLSSRALSGSVLLATEGSASLSAEALNVSLEPASNWPVTGLISNGRTLGFNDCFEEGDMSTLLWTSGEDFTEGLSPVSMQRSSAGLVWTGGWEGLEGVTLTLLIVLGTGLRVTAELGGGISL